MDFDTAPCRVCGAEVELRPRSRGEPEIDEPVGPAKGYVGDGDSTPDLRVCTNPDCSTHGSAELEA